MRKKKIGVSVLISFSLLLPSLVIAENKVAIFAGGCFWCMQADFDKLPGVIKTIAGYDGGRIKNPTYELVSSGKTRYVESIKIIYNNKKISYTQLLTYYWRQIDPTVQNAQFCDHGPQYRSVIFYLNQQQQTLAMQSKHAIQKHVKHVYTQIAPSTVFYPAETYHQNYYKKNPVRYKYYRWNCGRDQRLKELSRISH